MNHKDISTILLIPFLISIVGVAAFLMGYEFPTTWGQSVSMKISTASALCALSIASSFKGNARKHLKVFAILVMLVGLGGYGVATEETLTVGALVPSLGTIVSILILATGAILLSAIPLLISVFSVVGHAVNESLLFFYVQGVSTGIALPTAVCLIFLSIHNLCQSKHRN